MKFKTHVKPLQREGLIDMWDDRDISVGTEWEREIDKHLNADDIILLLISPDFMDSDYCYSIEMKKAVERHERGEAIVVPVILRPVDWNGAPFGKLQALPKDAKPITDWVTQDSGFHNVAKGIRKVVEELNTKRSVNSVAISEKTVKELSARSTITQQIASIQTSDEVTTPALKSEDSISIDISSIQLNPLKIAPHPSDHPLSQFADADLPTVLPLVTPPKGAHKPTLSDDTLKYYIYVSDAKLDMLYPQIPKSVLNRLASELSINLKLFRGEDGTPIKKGQFEETRYSKLRLIEKYIQQYINVGTIDEPGAYFKGVLSMRWGRLGSSETIYFTGHTSSSSDALTWLPASFTILGLGGSLKHVLGSTDSLTTQRGPIMHFTASSSAAPSILDVLITEIQSAPFQKQQTRFSGDTANALYAVKEMINHMNGPLQRFEFLARMLLKEDHTTQRILLGTPIYVALAD